jgi:ATP-dependent Clp protease protease subunit
MAKFWNWIKNQETDEPELRIEGDIGESFWGWLFDLDEVSPKKFRKELDQYKGKNLTVWINSNGGDVYAASQIYTALKEHKGKITVKVDGTAISAASVIAMAADELLMSPTSVMMIHNPWSGLQGESKDMRHMADVLDEVKDTIINAYQLKTNLSRDEISQLMDDETWMGARKAVEKGFADGALYEEENDESVVNGMVHGAKMVFNSIMMGQPKPQFHQETPLENNQNDDDDDDSQLKAKYDLMHKKLDLLLEEV